MEVFHFLRTEIEMHTSDAVLFAVCQPTLLKRQRGGGVSVTPEAGRYAAEDCKCSNAYTRDAFVSFCVPYSLHL